MSCKIHNVRFYKPKPEAIYCMALHKSKKKLAVSRANASIEIWSITHSPCIEKTIAYTADNPSIEGIVWCGDSLFSTGTHGFLVEYDLYGLTKKRMLSVTGEAAFCLDTNSLNTNIAVGTEQGYLNIFSINKEDILFEKFLDKQEGRILCLKYDPTDKFIVSGSIDAVRVWDVETGHAVHRITTGRSKENKMTIVWCIQVIEDLTIISGDSRGKLTFWDGKIGAQIESFQSHQADLLAIAVSDDKKSLYCSGVDANIINYVKVNVKDGTEKWVKSINRKIHDHDVRSLVLCNNKLYSGGIDGYLACSFYPPKTLIKYPPILQNPFVTLAKQARYIMLRHHKHIDVWSLGKSIELDKSVNNLKLESVPKHLLTLQRIVKDTDGAEIQEGIICSAISNDGKWIAFSTDTVLRIFYFNYEENDLPLLTPVKNATGNFPVSLQITFTSDNRYLILATRAGGIQIFYLRDGSPIHEQTIDGQGSFDGTIIFLTTSWCNQYLIAADAHSHISVWKLNDSEWVVYCKLPTYGSLITALAVKPNTSNVVVVYADHKIIEYNLAQMKLTKFSKSLDRAYSKRWPNKSFPIRNITFDPRAGNVTILHDDSNIVVMDKNKPLPDSDAKIPRIESTTLSDSNDSFKSSVHTFHAIKKYKHLLHLEWLSGDEMVAVEVNPLSFTEQLPPCFYQTPFGTK